jgi:hypothetical protein
VSIHDEFEGVIALWSVNYRQTTFIKQQLVLCDINFNFPSQGISY